MSMSLDDRLHEWALTRADGDRVGRPAGCGGDHHDGVPPSSSPAAVPDLGQGRRLFDNLGPEHIEP
jgi:hypothetical protein